MHIRSQDLVAWLRSRLMATGAEGLVVPITGSLEGAVVARLGQLAAREHVIGVLPAGVTPETAEAARALAGYLQIPIIGISGHVVAGIVSDLEAAVAILPHRSARAAEEPPLAQPELMQRLRMSGLAFIASSLNYLTAGTLDRTDLTLGTFASHGDDAVDVLPLGTALRSEVVALATDLELPPALAERAAADDDARREAIGVTHQQLERYLADGPDGVAPAVALKIERLMRESERKRGAAALPDLA